MIVRRSWFAYTIALGLPTGAAGQGANARNEITAFVDVAVVPMDTERVPSGQTVLVQGSRIAVGKQADLILLNGNPLEDLMNVQNPAGVMIGGRWLDRAELDQRLAAFQGTP